MRDRQIQREKLSIGQEIGSGRFGIVFYGTLKILGQEDKTLAIKRINKNRENNINIYFYYFFYRINDFHIFSFKNVFNRIQFSTY